MLVWVRKVVLQSESGVALLLTLMLMVVFSLLSVSLFEMLKASTQISGNHRWDLRATYIADAGVEHAVNELREDPTLGEDPATCPVDLFDPPVSFAGGTYEVVINPDGPITPSNMAIAYEKDIRCTASLSGFQRIVEAHVKILKVLGSDPLVYLVIVTSWELQ